MEPMEAHRPVSNRPVSIGLVGDGDEIAAIDAIEAAFGVTLDYAGAPTWRTAGDLFRALQSRLSPDLARAPDSWDRFAAALADETGVDPATITADSPLIDEARAWRGLGNLSGMMAVLLLASLALVALLVFALV